MSEITMPVTLGDTLAITRTVVINGDGGGSQPLMSDAGIPLQASDTGQQLQASS